jgi:tetratricopeptide (TPR) repeat protein
VLARKVENEALTSATLHEQGLIYNEMARVAESDEEREGYRETAVSRFQDSLPIQRRIGDDAGTAGTLGELGKLLRDVGQMNEAINAFNEALATFRKLGDPVKAAISIELLGSVHERQGQYAAARDKYLEALALLQQYGSPQHVAIVQNDIARVQAKIAGG